MELVLVFIDGLIVILLLEGRLMKDIKIYINWFDWFWYYLIIYIFECFIILFWLICFLCGNIFLVIIVFEFCLFVYKSLFGFYIDSMLYFSFFFFSVDEN